MPISDTQRQYNNKYKKQANEAKYVGKIEGVDYIVCKVCGLKSSQLSKHVKSAHGLTPEEYRTQHGADAPLVTQQYEEQLRKRALTSNPSAGHGGKYSAHSPKFIRYVGLPPEEVETRIAAVKARAAAERIKIPSTTTLQYWLNRTGGDVDAARALQSERQRTFSLKKCIATHGEEEGAKRWVARQTKWSNSFAKSSATKGFSTVADSLFAKLPLHESVYTHLNNKERTLTTKLTTEQGTKRKTFRPDYLDDHSKKVIEFYGDYFHANPKKYKSTDVMRRSTDGSPQITAQQIWDNNTLRENGLRSLGYDVMVVWEADYRVDPERITQLCIQFLNN